MSAALQLPLQFSHQAGRIEICAAAQATNQRKAPKAAPKAEPEPEPLITWAFYRKHTQNLLQRYLYASLQVGRAPNILGEAVGRGWISSRRIRTFEDALIFVLDVEKCINRLPTLDRQLINRILLQEHTYAETAILLRTSTRTIQSKLPEAIDRLTEDLVNSNLLILPD